MKAEKVPDIIKPKFHRRAPVNIKKIHFWHHLSVSLIVNDSQVLSPPTPSNEPWLNRSPGRAAPESMDSDTYP